jgi:type IV pilus assembly protein PilC
MKFRYKARTNEGELQVGFVEAPTKEGAVGILAGHGLYILSIAEAEKRNLSEQLLGFLNRVSAKDLMVFTRQFATLLSANVPLGDTVKTLINQTRNPILKEAIIDIRVDLDSGLSLSQALSRHGNIFSVFYVNMIQSAEITGRVENIMSYLADYIEKQVALTSKVRNALIYPVIMVILFFAVSIIMGSIVLPQIGVVFKDLGVGLPAFTSLLIAFGSFLSSWWWAVLLAIAALAAFILDYLKTPEGRTVLDEVVLRIPVFNRLLRQLYVARFAESLSILIKGGIPIVQAIEVTGRTISSAVYEEVLHQVAEDVRKGGLLSQSLVKKETFFPPLVSQMVSIGESTGRLEGLLDKISAFYTREVEDLVSNLVELIQPMLMIVIGVLIGLLFASILSPIYKLVSTF